ncbi:hypothetical protein PYW07_014510 [Mythimna separata]|uniref:Uncharacterized protein n=1 Tax=Mythimna separata TaxID=271217 RepID=A0AAD8E0I6_MYTSE|nr:hypothetical protein PYW07_014510 [Mythimna separata]
MASPGKRQSMETILTFDNRDNLSQWSVVWSTTHIEDMENAAARTARVRKMGRWRLRIGSLALSALLTMHCRLTAAALTGEFFFFILFLIIAVAALANPVRHFEVYLGQWSISGPGRAFRMIPMLDGIGIAICINAIVRAISCCTMAAITALYVAHAVSDRELPFKQCRNFNLENYAPTMKEFKVIPRGGLGRIDFNNYSIPRSVTVGLRTEHKAWRNASYSRRAVFPGRRKRFQFLSKIKVCKEKYAGKYPPMYTTPAYNFFFVELVKYRDVDNLGEFNVTLGVAIILVWVTLWLSIIVERISHGRVIYSNIKRWIMLVPWIWCAVLIAQAISNLTLAQTLRKFFRLGNRKDTIAAVADAFELALYIHSVGVGSELIHGKALHYYASGHIDPDLHGENVWHSGIVLILAGLHTGGAAMCAIVDYKHFNTKVTSHDMKESTLWILPMYSKCTSMGNYTHLVTSIIFGGLSFSYMTVAHFMLKSALHTIFEYQIKLVNWEQLVVAGLILPCMGLNMLYATNGGIELLECIDSIMTGLAISVVVLFELICLLYVYRSHDFQSDLHVATEESTCSSRIGIQWQIVPFITVTALCMKVSMLPDAEMSPKFMIYAIIPLAALILALPLRAACNACSFMRHKPPTT